MDTDTIVQDLLNKGFIVVFRPTRGHPPWEARVDRPGDYDGQSPFSAGVTPLDALITAARAAHAAGY